MSDRISLTEYTDREVQLAAADQAMFLTDTRGTGVMNHTFHEYAPYKGPISGRKNGVLVMCEVMMPDGVTLVSG